MAPGSFCQGGQGALGQEPIMASCGLGMLVRARRMAPACGRRGHFSYAVKIDLS